MTPEQSQKVEEYVLAMREIPKQDRILLQLTAMEVTIESTTDLFDFEQSVRQLCKKSGGGGA
ncbi:hypothetical protein SAMN05444000_102287 [Shimia gijangensis]|uniref:Uncharacterized protein n=1 Tax=Shimia gijangensis TaxID=1470563 RepID=A0A1M6DCQ4_9RHOB|nr:hypothetical protein [Shimia gijangensis]SHI70973.1 hypothetical protein SAMN05444000_102287 [Shimia gijangensis]